MKFFKSNTFLVFISIFITLIFLELLLSFNYKKINKTNNISFSFERFMIFQEGDVGDSMFIIINGSVSVYNQKKEITTLERAECFGEMALLDREPRSSSIRTVIDTVVLKIDEESFYELVAGNIEIIQGIVKILSKRLRQSIA